MLIHNFVMRWNYVTNPNEEQRLELLVITSHSRAALLHTVGRPADGHTLKRESGFDRDRWSP